MLLPHIESKLVQRRSRTKLGFAKTVVAISTEYSVIVCPVFCCYYFGEQKKKRYYFTA